MDTYNDLALRFKNKILTPKELKEESRFRTKREIEWLVTNNAWNTMLKDGLPILKTYNFFKFMLPLKKLMENIFENKDFNKKIDWKRAIYKHPIKSRDYTLVWCKKNGFDLVKTGKLRTIKKMLLFFMELDFDSTTQKVLQKIGEELFQRENPQSKKRKKDWVIEYFKSLDTNTIYKKEEIVNFVNSSLESSGQILSERAAIALAERVVDNLYFFERGHYCLLDNSIKDFKVFELKVMELIFKNKIFSASLLKEEFLSLNSEWAAFKNSPTLIHNFIKKNIKDKNINCKRTPIITSWEFQELSIDDCFTRILRKELKEKGEYIIKEFLQLMNLKYGFSNAYTSNLLQNNKFIKNNGKYFYFYYERERKNEQ